MAWNESAVTNAGAALLTASVSGELLTLSSVAGGTGTEAAADLPDMTELTNQKQVFTLKSIEDDAAGKKIRFLISNSGLTTGYTMNQVGIWGKLPDDAQETLLMVIQDESGMDIPSESEVQDFVVEMFVILVIGSTANISITVEPTALVTVAEFEVLEAEVEGLHATATSSADGLMSAADKVKMDAIQLGYKIYNSVTELGITAGAATLASVWSALPSNSMLMAHVSDFASAQRPPITNESLIEVTKSHDTWSRLGRIMAYPRDEATHIYRMGLQGNMITTPSGTWEAIAFTSEIGDLSILTTTAKTSAVAAINEVDSKASEAIHNTGWQSFPYDTGFENYSSSADLLQYRRIGNVVELEGTATPTTQIAAGGDATIGTLLAGYRPDQTVRVVCQGSGKATWLLAIDSDGVCTFSRYGAAENEAATASPKTWLPIHAVFLTTNAMPS